MTQNGNNRIQCVGYDVGGSRTYASILINLGRNRSIRPIAKSVASDLTDKLSNPVRVGEFTPNTRHVGGGFQPGGAYATFYLSAEGRPDLYAVVECSDKISDWANVRLKVKNGLNVKKFLEYYASRNLKQVYSSS